MHENPEILFGGEKQFLSCVDIGADRISGFVRLCILLLGAALLISGCGGHSSSGNESPKNTKTATAVAVSFSPSNLNPVSASTVRCLIGQPLQLKATESYSDGTSIDITSSATWSSSSPSVATVSTGGAATCLQPGAFNITVTVPSDCTGACSVAALNGIISAQSFGVSLSIKAPFQTVEVGSSLQLDATETLITAAGQTTADVTSSVSWNSLSPSIAIVTPGGDITGLQVGSVSFQATSPDKSLSPATIALQVAASTANMLTLTGLSPDQVVAPGSSITVTFSLPTGYTQPVLLVPFADAAPAVGDPPAVTLTIPPTTLGHVSLIPAGLNPENSFVIGSILRVDVEPQSLPVLSISPTSVQLQFIGAQQPIMISTQSGDYSGSMLNDSSLVAYSITDPTVASVDANGTVTGVGAGSTTLSVVSGTQMLSIPISVPSLMRGDLDGDGVIDQSDVNILSQYIGTNATTKNDARDLNGDGVIDASDVSIEKGLCGSICQ